MKYASWVQIEVIFGAVSLTMPSKNCRTSWVPIDIYRWPVKNSFSRFSPVNTRYCMHSIPAFSRYSQIGMYDFQLQVKLTCLISFRVSLSFMNLKKKKNVTRYVTIHIFDTWKFKSKIFGLKKVQRKLDILFFFIINRKVYLW